MKTPLRSVAVITTSLLLVLASGCALTASVSADRSINNALQLDQKRRFAVRAMDPEAEHAVEFRSLAISLTRELTAVGMAQAAKPDTLFLLGYSMELAKGSNWDRTLVVYGYDVPSGKRVYEATIRSVGRIASAYEIGDVFFRSLAQDIHRQGEIKDTVTYPHIPRS